MGTICTVNNAACSAQTDAIQRRGAVSRLRRLFWRAISWISEREEKRLSRLVLAELTDDQLADIGVTPAEARREAARPFWN